MIRISISTTAAFGLLLGVLSAAASAQSVRLVPQDHPTIQSAITASQPGDTVLVDGGTYKEQLDFLGKAIVVIALDGPQSTTIDASNLIGWFDAPFLAAVRFINNEGPGSVLQGFTITGHDSLNTSGQDAPIWSSANPTIVGCQIVNNRGKSAGGFFGSGTLSGCLLDGNTSFLGGGGVNGTAQLFDCVISNNSAPGTPGGGILASSGLTATRCLITGNSVALDGHSGGGSAGPAVLVDCEITHNVGDEFGGQNQGGASAVVGALLIDGCTLTKNVFIGNGGYAVGAAQTVVDSIIWDNTQVLGEVIGSTVTYSDVEGGEPGVGNIDLDPLFVDPGADDFRLQRTSPCIDAGDPLSAPDPDGTPADMGANFVPQYAASWTFRWGTTFTLEYVPQNNPVIGSTLLLDVTVTPSTTTTAVFVFALPSSPIATPFGELLVDPTSALLLADLAVPQAGVSTHSVPIPNDTDSIGVEVYSQAVLLAGPTALTNAVDFFLGL